MANGLLTIHIWFKHVKTKIKHIYLYHLIQANLTEPSQPNHQSIYWTIRLYIHPWKNITIYIYIDPLNHSFIYPPIHWTAHQSNHVLLPCAVQLHQSTNTRHYNQDFQATYPLYQSQTRAPPPQKKTWFNFRTSQYHIGFFPVNFLRCFFLCLVYINKFNVSNRPSSIGKTNMKKSKN